MIDRDESLFAFGNEFRSMNRRLDRREILSAFSTRGLGTLIVFGDDRSSRDIAERVLRQREEIPHAASNN